jgi:hypothetical protein
LAGISYWVNKHFKLPEERMVGKQDWLVKTLKEEIDALYADGRTTVMGEEELEAIYDAFSKDGRSKFNHSL